MLLERLESEINGRFTNWAFRGSIVDWHYFGGQVIIKDFDIVTSDSFESTSVCSFWGPRTSWKFMGRMIDVFAEDDPGPRMQTIESRMDRLRWIAEKIPASAERAVQMLERYERLISSRASTASVSQAIALGAPKKTASRTCTHRGGQVRTMTSDLCGQRGKDIPVYSCGLHGECTHGQVCKGQDPKVRICLTCEDGPWAF